MSTDSNKFDKQSIRKLQDEVMGLKIEDTFKGYCINHPKAEIRLLRDTLTEITGESKEALYEYVAMNETLNTKLGNGYHMKYNGEEIHYVGEHNPVSITEPKVKCYLYCILSLYNS